MYGAIIGDIGGSAYERHAAKDKGIRLFRRRSRVTDDTVMTVAVAEVLLDREGPGGSTGADESGAGNLRGAGDPGYWSKGNEEELRIAFAKSMKKWGRRYPSAGYGRRFTMWLVSDELSGYGSFGNGSAMRVSPCAWMADNMYEVRKLAAISSEATHDHPEGIKGAEAVTAAIFLARTGHSKDEIREYVEREFDYDLDRTCDEIRPDYSFDVTCQGSVPEAIICFLDGVSYEDTIRNAISLGGDADTQAAMAGAIAEAFYGIPDQMIDMARSYIPADMQEVIDRFYGRFGGDQ